MGAELESLLYFKTAQVVRSAGSEFEHLNGDETTSCLVSTLQD